MLQRFRRGTYSMNDKKNNENAIWPIISGIAGIIFFDYSLGHDFARCYNQDVPLPFNFPICHNDSAWFS